MANSARPGLALALATAPLPAADVQPLTVIVTLYVPALPQHQSASLSGTTVSPFCVTALRAKVTQIEPTTPASPRPCSIPPSAAQSSPPSPKATPGPPWS